MSDRYQTILADPPWTFRSRPPKGTVSYPTLSTPQLVAMGSQIQNLAAPNSHMYLWSTQSHLADALIVIEAWGFTYIQLITWFKVRMGLGSYFRHFTEPLLFSVRGHLRLLRRDLPNYFVEPRRKHSQKPNASYRLIEIASPGPRLELFARDRREGWCAWGNEVESDVVLNVPSISKEKV